ncbi:MAG: DUF2000 domain-containing protein [[Clostridium] innocuum]
MEKNRKCVMVMDASLTPGIAANTAALLGMTLGSKVKEAIGCDVQDADGNIHMGILQIPLPILKMETEKLQELRRQLFDQEYEDVIIVDFSDAAQTCNVYEDWIVKAKNLPENQFHYLGIGLYGDKKKINRLCGSLPLYR